ncbi:MAG: acyltransferase family protein [Planctomycetota bacterium]
MTAATPARSSYLPALDGLRGVSVMMVVLYHADVPVCEGGFVGVETFFVISGFLITGLLLKEHARAGRLQLLHFYMRRVLRLLPALVALLLVVGAIGLRIAPNEATRRQVMWDLVSTLLYAQNWTWALGWRRPGLFAHTWSLSIEEQFYLLWPLTLLLLLRLSPRARTIAVGLLALAAGAWAATTSRHWVQIYLLSDTRSGSLLLGCFLACLVDRGLLSALELRRRTLSIAAVLGAGALAICLVGASEKVPAFYRCGIPIIGLSASAIVLDTIVSPAGYLGRCLRWRWLVWVGERSYGVYLWHYPILLVLEDRLAWPARALVGTAATLLVAAASYRWLERPFLELKVHFRGAQAPGPPAAGAPPLPGEASAPR